MLIGLGLWLGVSKPHLAHPWIRLLIIVLLTPTFVLYDPKEKLQPSDQLKGYISQLRKYAKNIFSPIDCRLREKKVILRMIC